MIGETLGNYRVTAKLGEGGMGAVFLAEHIVIGRKAAVKVLRPDHARDSEMLQRFFLEARSTASLRHPALVDILDYGFHTSGSPFIVMEFVPGESLAARIKQLGRLSPFSTVEIAHQIAIGMGVAHAAGLVHRDLKPANVLLTPDRTGRAGDAVKILDFGIAKLLNPDPSTGPLTQMSALLGTPMYMAPEQCMGAANVDHRADIYALGCMAYEMACGAPPFPLTSLRELIAAHIRGAPVRPRKHRREIPSELEAMILTALAKEPGQRQSSMEEVAEQLERCRAKIERSSGAPLSGDNSTGRSIYPVSKSARHSFGSFSDEALRSRRTDPRRAAWTALIAGAVVACTGAALWTRRHTLFQASERTPPVSLSAPTLSIVEPPAPKPPPPAPAPVPSAATSEREALKTPAPTATLAPTATVVTKPPGGRPRPVRTPDAGAPAAPPPAREAPSLGGDMIENPWSN